MEITPPCVLWDEKLLRVILPITPPCVSWSNFTPHHLGKLLRLCGSLMGSIRHRKVGGGVGRLVGVCGVGTRLGGRQETGRLAEAWTTGKVFSLQRSCFAISWAPKFRQIMMMMMMLLGELVWTGLGRVGV